jgi:DNA-binding transcriptional regulator YdaS (Cro superfamily)
MGAMDTQAPPLERAITAADGITKLASLLGLKSHAVIHQWRLNRIPADHCPSIERVTREIAATKGDPSIVVTCEEMRAVLAGVGPGRRVRPGLSPWDPSCKRRG